MVAQAAPAGYHARPEKRGRGTEAVHTVLKIEPAARQTCHSPVFQDARREERAAASIFRTSNMPSQLGSIRMRKIETPGQSELGKRLVWQAK